VAKTVGFFVIRRVYLCHGFMSSIVNVACINKEVA
jgi:hypothetical protein